MHRKLPPVLAARSASIEQGINGLKCSIRGKDSSIYLDLEDKGFKFTKRTEGDADKDTLIYVADLFNANAIDYLHLLYGNIPEEAKLTSPMANLSNLRPTSLSMLQFKFVKLATDAVTPSKAHYSDAGYDLTCIREIEKTGIDSDTKYYGTGISLSMPFGYYAAIVPRSSISKTPYSIPNSPGTADLGYNGEIIVAVRRKNASVEFPKLPFCYSQAIFMPCVYGSLVEIKHDEVQTTQRGDGGFGSSSGDGLHTNTNTNKTSKDTTSKTTSASKDTAYTNTNTNATNEPKKLIRASNIEDDEDYVGVDDVKRGAIKFYSDKKYDWLRNDYGRAGVDGFMYIPGYHNVDDSYHKSKYVYQGADGPTIAYREVMNQYSGESLRYLSARDITKPEPALGLKAVIQAHPNVQIDPQFETYKTVLMESFVKQKFELNPRLSAKLADTGSLELIADNDDSEWGTGTNNTGLNGLGKLLMTIRGIHQKRSID